MRSLLSAARCALWLVLFVFCAQLQQLRAADKFAPAYSQLSDDVRSRIEQRIAPPPLHERQAPYSTPMYYLLAKGYYDGPKDEILLDRNRPDWQEVLMKDWAELGLTSTLYMTGPTEWDNPDTVKAIQDYLELSRKYGLKVGVRLAGDGKFQGIDAGGWDVHPRNPKSQWKRYREWVARVAETMKGKVEYYTFGDELNGRGWEQSDGKGGTIPRETAEDHSWTPEDYMQVFRELSETIKGADPDAKVSMFGMNGLDWKYLDRLLKLDYAKYGDGVAANPDDHKYPFGAIREFADNVRKVNPKFKLYSNGVGYVAADAAAKNPNNAKHWKFLTDDQQANRIAQMMIAMFHVNWDVTPYYILIRQWNLPDGRVAPHWYGFFGVCDLDISADDKLSVRRHAGWYALQTVAHTLYNRDKTPDAPFELKLSEKVDNALCYVRNDYECLIVLWQKTGNEGKRTSITLPTARFAYPVKVSLTDYHKPQDLPYHVDGDTVTIPDLEITDSPTIIRLVAEPLPNNK